MTKKNTHTAIRQAMRDNETELLAHLRKYRVNVTAGFGMAWHNALDRLQAAGKVKYDRKQGAYVARKGARAVTRVTR